MNNLELLQTQLEKLQQGERFAVVTIVEAHGLARTNGKMLVFPDGSIVGTVGGGYGELAAKKDALDCLKTGKNAVKSHDFTEEMEKSGICARGGLTVFIECCQDERTPLVVLGGGHVGHAVINVAKTAGFTVTLADDRSPAALGGSAEAADRFLALSAFEDIGEIAFPANTFFVICTYHHQATERALKGVLRHKDAAYIGLLSSRNKFRAMRDHLLAQGVPEAELERIYTPIGLDIGGESPEEVAVSIVAELLAVKYHRTGAHLSPPGCKNRENEEEKKTMLKT